MSTYRKEQEKKRKTVFWSIYFLMLLGTAVFFRTRLAQASHLLYLFLVYFILLTGGLCLFLIRREKRTSEKRHIRIWQLLLLPLQSIYLFLALELVNNPDFFQMSPFYMLINVIGISMVHLIFLAALNRFRLSSVAYIIFMTCMSAVFYTVMLMRGEPFQFIDLFSIGTAMEVVGHYQFEMPASLLSFILMTLCICALYARMPETVLVKRGKIKKLLLRVVLAGFLFGGHYLYLNTSWNADLDILTDLFAPIKTYKKYGTQLGFFCVAKYMRLTAPEGYSTETAKKAAQESVKAYEAAGTKDGSDNNPVKPVNIIAIMNESWADYRYLGDGLKTNIPVMPYYDSMHENTIKGHTLVCITGGGTAKTEYEFLTGNSVKRFPAMVPYVSYFTHSQYSLVTTLEAQGYKSIAMHPYVAKNWNRPAAYRLLNFDTFLSEDDWPADADRIRGLISDKGDYDEIVRQVEAKKHPNDPLFIFNVTMQNHGGYKSSSYSGPVQTEGYSDAAANQFLSLIHESDNAIKELIEHFKAVQQPTLIVMFGDHYPDLPESFTEYVTGKTETLRSFEEEMHAYATPFFIWANYDIPEAEGVVTSTNYLGTMMLEQTSLAMAPYNHYLEQLREKIPAMNHLGFYGTDGIFHKWENGAENIKKTANIYDILQYNNLAERKNRLDWFFTVQNKKQSK